MDPWWIDKPQILGTDNPTTSDLEHLGSQGFAVLVSLLREDEQAPRYDLNRIQEIGFVRHNIPVRDFTPPTVEQLLEFIHIVEGLGERKLIVHCQAGMGRTGTFAAAYWIERGMVTAEAIARIRRARTYAIETPEQVAVLEEFSRRRKASRLEADQAD